MRVSRAAKLSCCGQQQCACPRGPRGPPGPAGDIDWGVNAIAYVQASCVTLSMGFESDGTQAGAGFFVGPNLVMTAWSSVARQARGIRVIVTLPSGPAISVDGVLVGAVPTLGIAFVHVNPSLFHCTGFSPVPLAVASDALAGQTVFTYPMPSHTGFATGVVAQTSYGTTGYTTALLLAGVETALYGSAVIRASDYAIVGMVLYSVSGTDVMAAVPGSLLQWAMARYGVYDLPTTTVLPGFGRVPDLRRALALGQQVGGYIHRGNDTIAPVDVSVYVPMVTQAVNPADTTYFRPGTQYQTPQLTLGAPATGAWIFDPTLDSASGTQITANSPNLVVNFDGNAFAVTPLSPTVDEPVPVAAADIGVARSMAQSVAAFESSWTVTTTDIAVSTTSVFPGERVYAFPEGTFYISVDLFAVPPVVYSQKFMVVYADLGVVAFMNSTADAPSQAAILADIESPASIVALPYIAAFASADLNDAFVTYSKTTVDTVDKYVITWSSVNALGTPVNEFTPQYEFQVVYAGGSVQTLYRTMPTVWPTNNWLAGTTLTSLCIESDPDTFTVQSTQLVALNTLPQTLEVASFGLASIRSNLLFVQSTDVSAAVGQGAVAPTRTSTGDTIAEVSGTLALVQQNGVAIRFGHVSMAAKWLGYSSPARAMTVNGQQVGQVGVNDASLPVTLTRVAPLASALSPVGVTVLVADVAAVGAPVSVAPGSLWTAVRALLGVPPLLAGGTSANSLVFDFSLAPTTYTAAAFMLPANDVKRVEADIVSATFKLRLPASAPAPVAGDTFIIQLAATDSSGITTRFPEVPGLAYETCAIVSYDGSGWTLAITNGYGSLVLISSEPYVLGDDIVLVAPPADSTPQRVNTVVVGLPPTVGTPHLQFPATQLAPLVSVTIVDLQTQVLGVYSTSNGKQFAVTVDQINAQL